MQHSLWTEAVQMPRFPQLTEDLQVETLIIGGGMAGILCADALQRAGIDYALVEQNQICGGVTAGTTAKITSQHGLCYAKLVRRFGLERAAMYLQANEAALENYRKLCQNIDCDFQTAQNYVFEKQDANALHEEVLAVKRLGFPAKFVSHVPMDISVAGAVMFPNQAQFHPLKFAAEITKGLRIFERTKIRELVGTTAKASHATIRAKNVIVATHFPFLNKHGSYFLKLHQHRSYVLGLTGTPKLEGMYADASKDGLSFRQSGDILLLGGGSHRTGKQGGSWQELEGFVKQHYPDAIISYRWATQDCMSLDDVPYIGHYSANTPNLYVATGFNKWGMTGSMTAAILLSDMLQGKRSPYAAAFSPSRSILHPQLAINGFESVLHLLKPSKKRCPHLGCALSWNKAEHSWDCPCHGSRFTQDGTLLCNPATADLSKKQR